MCVVLLCMLNAALTTSVPFSLVTTYCSGVSFFFQSVVSVYRVRDCRPAEGTMEKSQEGSCVWNILEGLYIHWSLTIKQPKYTYIKAFSLNDKTIFKK